VKEPFQDRKATKLALTLYSHNLPNDRARELSNRYKEAEISSVGFKKHPGTLWFEPFFE